MGDLLDPVKREGSDYRGGIYHRAAAEEACLRNNIDEPSRLTTADERKGG
jgi:hypothetical protein